MDVIASCFLSEFWKRFALSLFIKKKLWFTFFIYSMHSPCFARLLSVEVKIFFKIVENFHNLQKGSKLVFSKISLGPFFITYPIFFYFENRDRFSKTDFTIGKLVGQNLRKSLKKLIFLKKGWKPKIVKSLNLEVETDEKQHKWVIRRK